MPVEYHLTHSVAVRKGPLPNSFREKVRQTHFDHPLILECEAVYELGNGTSSCGVGGLGEVGQDVGTAKVDVVNGTTEAKHSLICSELENHICGVGLVGNDLILE